MGLKGPSRIVLGECWARDGLQHEPAFVPTAEKVRMLDRFTDLGFGRIEVTSFAHPKYIPQFADAEAVLAGIKRSAGIAYKATCANLKAVERALAASAAGTGPTEISFLLSASEAHSKVNLKKSHADQWAELEQMMAAARPGGYSIVMSLSTVFGCPFTGDVPVQSVLAIVDRMVAMGAGRVLIGDTTGMANPVQVYDLFTLMVRRHPHVPFIAHFHDSRGIAIANCVAAWQAGVEYFDSCIGGVGGHPSQILYGDGFTGNACTEDLVAMFHEMGVNTGVAIDGLVAVAQDAERVLGRQLTGMVARSGLVRHQPGAIAERGGRP